LPSARPQDHQIKIQCQIGSTNSAESGSSEEEGSGLVVSWSASATGFPDYALRATARANKARHESLPLLQNEFTLANGSFALEKQSHNYVADLDEDCALRPQGQTCGICYGSALLSLG